MKSILWLLISCFAITIVYSQKTNKNLGIKKIIETETYSVTQNGIKYNSITEVNETHFNKNGKKKTNTQKTYSNGKPYRTTITDYTYREDGQVFNANCFVVEDSTHYTIKSDYVNNKLVKKSTNYLFEDKNIVYKENYKYNKRGKLSESVYIYSEKFLDSSMYSRYLKATTLYDKKERTKSTDWRESDSTYKYNKYKFFRNNKGILSKEKEYDRNNNLVKTSHFECEFDEKDNWILFKTYENKKLTKFIYREIEYY